MLLLGRGSPGCNLPEPVILPEPWEVAKSPLFLPTGSSCSAGTTAQGNAFPKLHVYLHISLCPAAAPAHGALIPIDPVPRCCPSCASGIALTPAVPAPLSPGPLCPALLSARAGRALPGWVTHQNKEMKCDMGQGDRATSHPSSLHCHMDFWGRQMGRAAPLLPGSLGDNLARAADE